MITAEDAIGIKIHGSRRSAFFSELLTNSGYFLIFNTLAEISLQGLSNYVFGSNYLQPGFYIIVGATLSQTWYLSRPNARRFWGNFIGPGIYTIIDVPLDGMHFFEQSNHWVLWGFSLLIAILQGLRFHWKPIIESWIIPLENLVRTFIFVALYIGINMQSSRLGISEETKTIISQPADRFLISGMVVFGIILGLQVLQITTQRKQLQKTAQLLRNLAEWGMGSHAVFTAITNPEKLEFHRCDRTILFMDIRGFTSWCEETKPDIVAAVLNEYYRNVEPAAAQHQPLKITLTADEIMAIYATPQQGIAAAKTMSKAALKTLTPYKIGAGCAVHCGSVIEGLFGSQDVRTYTVIGDVVNTAKRLESATASGEITISDEIYQALDKRINVEACAPISAKGKAKSLIAWRIIDY